MNDVLNNILEKFNCLTNKQLTILDLNEIKTKFLGKNGEITNLLKNLKNIPVDERPQFGKQINDIRNRISSFIEDKENKLLEELKNKKLQNERIDVTLSDNKRRIGANHPLTIIKNQLIDCFLGLGFSIGEGPEIELDKYNFQLLNIPEDHPARDMQDTFYISNNILLRTQTSAIQARVMTTTKPPIKLICPGKVYRADSDATHSPMFQQLEGLVVDKDINICDLKGCLDEFAKVFFGTDTKTRLRPSFFPFTEPSVEMDVSCFMCKGTGCSLCKGTGWIEILGAGIVNPIVLDKCGINSKEYSGFAFGIGIERCCMLKLGIPDIRILFDNDIRFLNQYR